jgi:hypothetical protein
MLRRTISATERTEVDATLVALRQVCAQANISEQQSAIIINHVREVLQQLIDRGKQLAAMGSQMRVTRDVTGSGYAIRLAFSANTRTSFFERLLASLRSR